MDVHPTEIPGVLVLDPKVFRDDRGRFLELWNLDRGVEAGLPSRFVQDNCSYSTRGVLRGLHYQHPRGQGKLVSVIRGAIFDVAADIRRGSPTYGRWVGVKLDGESGRQLYIPPGFAHGFAVLGEEASIIYKCTDVYEPSGDRGVAWDDPILAIDWPISNPLLSVKDHDAPRLDSIEAGDLPEYEPAKI